MSSADWLFLLFLRHQTSRAGHKAAARAESPKRATAVDCLAIETHLLLIGLLLREQVVYVGLVPHAVRWLHLVNPVVAVRDSSR